jgi:hypothetical protein
MHCAAASAGLGWCIMSHGPGGVIGTASDLRLEPDARLLERGPTRFVPVDAAQVETAVDRRDAICECSPSSRTCEERRGEVNALGKQRATNERFAALDGEIKILRDKLSTAPAVAAADPQVETNMEVLALASGGSLAPSKRAIEVWRLLGLGLIPCVMGGLLLPVGMLFVAGAAVRTQSLARRTHGQPLAQSVRTTCCSINGLSQVQILLPRPKLRNNFSKIGADIRQSKCCSRHSSGQDIGDQQRPVAPRETLQQDDRVSRSSKSLRVTNRPSALCVLLERDPEKWEPVSEKIMLKQKADENVRPICGCTWI